MSTHPTDLPALRAELAHVLASPVFRGAVRHCQLLGYLAEQAAAGDDGRLKETVLALEVFDRPADRFDPARDSIVRVEVRRLRQRLARHYAGPGAGSARRLELDPGQYRLHLASVVMPPGAAGVRGAADELADRGDHFLRQGHEEGCRKALERYAAATAADPGSARAWFGKARAWGMLAGMTFVAPTPAVDNAAAAAERALALDPAHAEALALLAGLRHRYALDWSGARALLERALRAAPKSVFLHHQFALSLMFVREFDAAEACLRTARGIDPLHTGLRAHEALLALYRRRWDEAERLLLALLDVQPNALAISLLGYLHLLRGRPDAALQRYREAQLVFPQLTIGAIGVAQAHALAGRADEARTTLAALQAARGERYLPPYQRALVAVALGDKAEALALLKLAADERDANFVCLPVDPGLDPLRALPAFKALEARCGPLGPPGPPAQTCAAGAQA